MRGLAVVVVATTWLACAPKKYYSLEFAVDARGVGESVRFPSGEARKALSDAKVVAFAPPDACADTSSGGDIMRQQCGEVMAALEEAASDVGFEVVSWQALRGDQPALSYARENHVDVLFEVNRLGADPSLVSSVGEMRFASVNAKGDRTPLAVSSAVQARCRDMLVNASSQVAGTGSVVLDVKMVSVKSSRTAWRYREVFTDSKLQETGTRIYYEPKKKPSPGKVVLLAGGASLLGVGVVFLAVAPLAESLLVPGLIGIAAGLPMTFFGSRFGHESPDDVMCKGKPIADPFAPSVAATPATSDRTSFQATVGAGNANKAVLRVARSAAHDFVEEVAILRALAQQRGPIKRKKPAQADATAQRPKYCDHMASWKQDGSIKDGDLPSECR